jgi:hypothetical protein
VEEEHSLKNKLREESIATLQILNTIPRTFKGKAPYNISKTTSCS